MSLFQLTSRGPVDPAVEIAAINRKEAAAALRRYAIPMSPNSPDRYCLFAIIDTLYKRGVDVQEVLITHLNSEYDAAEAKLQAEAASDAVVEASVGEWVSTDTQEMPAVGDSQYKATFDENGFYCG